MVVDVTNGFWGAFEDEKLAMRKKELVEKKLRRDGVKVDAHTVWVKRTKLNKSMTSARKISHFK